MRPRVPDRALPAIIAASLVIAAAGGIALGIGRDTAFYPVSAHELSEFSAPPLAFERLFETTVEGTPLGDPLGAPAHEGDPLEVRTTQGTFLLDPRTGAVLERRPPAPAAAFEAPPLACAPAGGDPSWLRPLHTGAAFRCTPGPGGVLAIVGRDGAIFGRHQRGGHLCWRRKAAHRVSRAPLNLGPYLLVAPDASRELQALRWSDGSPAGVFRLDSEDAYFVSAPVSSGDRIYVLAVESPKPQTRLIALVPSQQIGTPPPSAPFPPPAPAH